MIKNFLVIFLLITTLLFGMGSGIFGYLYVTKNNEYSDLLAKTLDSQNLLGNLATNFDSSNKDEIITMQNDSIIKFEDKFLKVRLEYPESWTLVLDTKITDEFAYEPVYGRIVQQYTSTLTKTSSKVTFEKIIGAVDGFPALIDKSKIDFIEINGSLIRYKEKSAVEWKYAEWLDCSDFVEIFGSPTASEVCISSFFPGFGNFANSAKVIAGDEQSLKEADKIAISALN